MRFASDTRSNIVNYSNSESMNMGPDDNLARNCYQADRHLKKIVISSSAMALDVYAVVVVAVVTKSTSRIAGKRYSRRST